MKLAGKQKEKSMPSAWISEAFSFPEKIQVYSVRLLGLPAPLSKDEQLVPTGPSPNFQHISVRVLLGFRRVLDVSAPSWGFYAHKMGFQSNFIAYHISCAINVRMARPKIHKSPCRTHITISSDIKKLASRHAFKLGLQGGLSELIARLLVAELNVGTIAQSYDRNLKPANN